MKRLIVNWKLLVITKQKIKGIKSEAFEPSENKSQIYKLIRAFCVILATRNRHVRKKEKIIASKKKKKKEDS